MSGRYGIGRLVESKEFNNLQNKLENLYESYNTNSNCKNVEQTCEIIEQNADVQRKLHGTLHDVVAEGGPIYHCPRPLLRSYVSHCDHYSRCYSHCHPSLTVSTAAAIAASASLSSDLALCRTLSRKNAEIEDLSLRFKKEVSQLENELSSTKQTNDELKAALNETKEKLENEKAHLDAIEQARLADIDALKAKLNNAESKLACLEPRAEKANELEKEISNLKDEIRHVRTANYILTDENILQAQIIRSRVASPCFIRSRTPSPCALVRSRLASPVCVRSRCVSPCITRVSPLSPNHCTQVVRQEALITRYNDLYLRDRLSAMDILRAYSDNYENNQRIIFAAVQDSFSAAKRAFYEWKIRVRSTVALTHVGPETLEEAVQDYINRNVDLYDMPRMVSDVLVSLNRNPKISLPCGVTYSVISQFIRESCRMAWEMTALAYPLDTAFALDAEVFDETRYRRSFDSEYSAPLISHHIWPCLMQSGCVISRGEACTRRGASLHFRPSSPSRCRDRSHSPMRRSRSSYHY